MNKRLNLFILAGLIIALILNSLYVIDEKQDGIVFQFGEVINSDIPTGLNFKLPIIQNVKKYDSRIQTLDEEPNRILTIESKYLIVDSFVKYRITNVRTFYDATSGSFINLNNLLGQRTAFELKNQFGRRTVTELVSGERDQLMSNMRENLGNSVSDLGIEIIDFRVKRIDLPPELSNSVHERMRSERNRLAEELRAEGNELSNEIRSTADKEKVIILAEAYKKAEQIKGDGDARAAAIYAAAFSKDSEFYEFTRSLRGYGATFNNKSDILLIDPKSDFFKYLNKSKGTNP
jgi:membrane protease subunit HflC